MSLDTLIPAYLGTLVFLVPLLVAWELVWKGIALWRAARNGSNVWFIFLLIVNSVGILPIIYILAFSRREKTAA